MSITLSPEVEARVLQRTLRSGRKLDREVENLVVSALEQVDIEEADLEADINASERAILEGRSRTFVEFIDEQREKYGFPSGWPTNSLTFSGDGSAGR